MQSKDDSLGMVYVRGGAPHTVKMVCFRDGLSENWASLWESSHSAVTADCMCIFSSSLQCSEMPTKEDFRDRRTALGPCLSSLLSSRPQTFHSSFHVDIKRLPGTKNCISPSCPTAHPNTSTDGLCQAGSS